MTTETCPIDRLSPTQRPRRRVRGYQRWSDLLFLHWKVPVSLVRPLVPPELTIDTWDNHAWIGLVPFHMSGVRPWWSPPVPGLSEFHETNVRTYVHLDGRDPGVWFFSLDAANSLAVSLARTFWHLPYYTSEMTVDRQGSRVEYRSQRLTEEPRPGLHIVATIGNTLPTSSRSNHTGTALPDTLEHFLAERYLLYAKSPSGQLYRGQVHHSPYPLREARLVHLKETLLASAHLPVETDPAHVMFSDGVSVEIFSLERINTT